MAKAHTITKADIKEIKKQRKTNQDKILLVS